MWSLVNLTLNGNLPIDVVEVNDSAFTYSKSRGRNKVLEVKGMRYFKHKEDGSSKFNTRLIAKNGVYGRREGGHEDNASLLVKAGLVEHENCIPYLSRQSANKRSKPNGVLHRVEILEVHLPSAGKCNKEYENRSNAKGVWGRSDENKWDEEANRKRNAAEKGKIGRIRQIFTGFL